MNKKSYVRKILVIICLTNIPAFLTLPWFYKEAIGWILGSIASGIRFVWLSRQIENNFDVIPAKARITSVKGFYLRFIFLVIYAVGIMIFVKPNIVMFGVGLLAAQIGIYVNYIYEKIKKSSCSRGIDDRKED